MPSVRITGWNVGLDKVSHTQVLQNIAGLSLSEAKAITDAVLQGRPTLVETASGELAVELATKLRALGAVTSVEP